MRSKMRDLGIMTTLAVASALSCLNNQGCNTATTRALAGAAITTGVVSGVDEAVRRGVNPQRGQPVQQNTYVIINGVAYPVAQTPAQAQPLDYLQFRMHNGKLKEYYGTIIAEGQKSVIIRDQYGDNHNIAIERITKKVNN